MIFNVLFGLSILVSVTLRGEGAPAAYVPTDVFLINCGATSDTNDTSGRTWTTEYGKLVPWNLDNLSFAASPSYQDVEFLRFLSRKLGSSILSSLTNSKSLLAGNSSGYTSIGPVTGPTSVPTVFSSLSPSTV